MSTLKVNTIQDASGNNPSTAAQIAQGRAKAWLNFNGTTVTSSNDLTGVRDYFNISSVVDKAVGDYEVNFATNMSNTNYVVTGNSNLGSNAQFTTVYIHAKTTSPYTQDPTVSTFRIVTGTTSVIQDPTQVAIAVFGD